MKFFITSTILVSSLSAAPLFGFGGLAAVDAGGLSVLSPNSDTFKYNYNAGFGNWKGPQYVPYNPNFFNPGFPGPAPGPQPGGVPGFPLGQRSQVQGQQQAQGQ